MRDHKKLRLNVLKGGDDWIETDAMNNKSMARVAIYALCSPDNP